jgi:hypothetical protein
MGVIVFHAPFSKSLLFMITCLSCLLIGLEQFTFRVIHHNSDRQRKLFDKCNSLSQFFTLQQNFFRKNMEYGKFVRGTRVDSSDRRGASQPGGWRHFKTHIHGKMENPCHLIKRRGAECLLYYAWINRPWIQ